MKKRLLGYFATEISISNIEVKTNVYVLENMCNDMLRQIKDRFSLPLIDDLLDKLQSSQVFSTIDLKNRFFPS